jgi:1-pyrroline-5-carboxylate dehydrogenase
MKYRPLEDSVFTVTPHNFTAIALNLAATLTMMDNVVLWKPASIG